MVETKSKKRKILLSEVIVELKLSVQMKFVCEKVFSHSDLKTLEEWQKLFDQKTIIYNKK